MTIEVSRGLYKSGWLLAASTKTLCALYRSNGYPKRLIVTFDELSAFTYNLGGVSGDRIVLKCQADHLHLSSSEARWFQTPEIFEIIEVMRKFCARYDEVILYGHSMGGYAALLFSGPLKATNVVAFAPQYSVDPGRVSFENRFNLYIDDVDFVFDDMASTISASATKHVVFDPRTEQDRMHVDLMLDFPNLEPFRLPFSGHFPAQFLQDAGCLADTVIDLLLEKDNKEERRQRVRSGRRRSYRYFLERALLAARRGHTKEGFKLASIAYVLNPENPSIFETYQALLMGDAAYYGVSHAMVRLIQLQCPVWTHYDSTSKFIWKELEAIAAPVIQRKSDPTR